MALEKIRGHENYIEVTNRMTKLDKENRYFYGRVSTKNQSLDVQAKYADDLDIPEGNRLLETVSGAKLINRNIINFIETIPEGSELYAMKLDRIGRSLQDILQIIELCREKNIIVSIGGFGVIDNNAQSNLMVSILGSFAQFERDLIVERFQAGREYQLLNNPDYKEGRKRLLTPNQVKLAYDRYKVYGEKVQDVADSFNVSKRTLQRRFREYENTIKAKEKGNRE